MEQKKKAKEHISVQTLAGDKSRRKKERRKRWRREEKKSASSLQTHNFLASNTDVPIYLLSLNPLATNDGIMVNQAFPKSFPCSGKKQFFGPIQRVE
ncbi:hypothetical protein TNIN_423491 [Trichonephila inaurata madagascariensis]|uniref:Uncharacterized protein n=1 Tax=Trichonephila inaurata madagascariensis TaxID=2747483 RepID=A0A8X6Y9M8_9ARAC|nr:hypothetical protein TNIN_423491 [Trichonephila inaurata madagascariensis]